jgi:hypothetical protein
LGTCEECRLIKEEGSMEYLYFSLIEGVVSEIQKEYNYNLSILAWDDRYRYLFLIN